jgi:predicted enzyme involved in methoxymalonyl-ACP biosynthesis
LVLGGDPALWNGDRELGDGPLDPGRRALHELALAQRKAGVALCLCGKGAEAEVFERLDRGPERSLRGRHLAAWRFDDQPRSEQLKSLAAELGIELGSVIYIGTDPEECAEVEVACPEIVTLELPAEDGAIPAFLRNIWVFDPPWER